MPDDTVRCEELSVSLGGSRILEGVTCRVQPGEVVGLLGPNGAGKTTTLRTLLGLCTADAGSVHVLGHDPAGFPREIRTAIGYAPERPPREPGMTGREVLACYARAMGADPSGLADRIASWLQRVELADAADQTVETYSKGMQQRLNIARAAIHDPKLLILDEPGSGLDPRGRAQMRDLVNDLSSGARTILMSTHDVLDIAEAADRVLLMRQGRIAAETQRTDRRSVAGWYNDHVTRGTGARFVPA